MSTVKKYKGLGEQKVWTNGKKLFIKSKSSEEVCTFDDITFVSFREPLDSKIGNIVFKTKTQTLPVSFRSKDIVGFSELFEMVRGIVGPDKTSDTEDDDFFQDDFSYALEENKLNKCLLISLILGVAYMIYGIVYWAGAVGSQTGTAEQIGAGIATALIMPHLAFTVLAVIFNALGLFMRKWGFALTGAILYSVALVVFPLYFMFVIVQMILSYIGFAKMKKQAA